MTTKAFARIAAIVVSVLLGAAGASGLCYAWQSWAATDADKALLKEVDAIIRDADKAIAKQDWPTANGLLKRGIDKLGDHCHNADTDAVVLDDSGLHLIAADIEEQKGHLQNAATNRRGILAERLDQFRENLGQTTIWRKIELLGHQLPFTRAKIEKILGAQLRETPHTPKLTIAEGGDITLEDGTHVAKIELRFFTTDAANSLILDIDGPCITLAQVANHYGELKVTNTPHGQSFEETTAYSAVTAKFGVSFGFKERDRNCVGNIAIGSKDKWPQG